MLRSAAKVEYYGNVMPPQCWVRLEPLTTKVVEKQKHPAIGMSPAWRVVSTTVDAQVSDDLIVCIEQKIDAGSAQYKFVTESTLPKQELYWNIVNILGCQNDVYSLKFSKVGSVLSVRKV